MAQEPTTSFQPGDVIAEKYVLVRPLAKGGMGQVWAAKNELTERKVAIKFMLPELAQSPDTVQRFFREAKASARIDHPCIVDVLDLGTLQDGAPFLVMEFLEGRSLEQLIEAQPLGPIQAAALLLDVVHALSAAHAAGIVHRDLKPANIFIAKKGEQLVPKILDFGISKITSSMGDVRMTRTGAVLGSPAYMSPEQARGRTDIDGRADIWAIGVILYEAVSGKLPFGGENYNQVMMAITLDPPTPLTKVAPAVDNEFVAIVDACLKKERDERPASMEALAALLDGYVAPRAAYGIPALEIGEPGEARKPASTHRLGAYAVPRAVPTKPPPSSTRENDPTQVTVGAVTVVDRAPYGSKRSRALVFAAAGLVLVAGGAGAYVALNARAPSASSAPEPPKPVATPVASPIAPPESSPAPTEAPPPPSSVAVAPSASASSAPTASASATNKKPVLPIKPPKPKSTDDGPANVGPGPGF